MISDETGEHEVRFRESDQRAVKRTWNGTFGMVPEWSPAGWRPASATPLEYLQRFALHNAIFLDDVRLEGVIVVAETSRIPGAIPGGCSLVISQRWLVAANTLKRFALYAQVFASLALTSVQSMTWTIASNAPRHAMTVQTLA